MSTTNCSLDVLSDKSGWLCPPEEQCFNLSSRRNGSHLDVEDACLTEAGYLEKYLGPRRSPVFLPIFHIYLIIFMVGVVGNVLTCTVIARNKVMRTPTNYYLFSLAVSDLLVLLLGMPLELYELWQNYPFLFGKGGCYFKTFLFETVCLASILNVTALSVERYIAVVHPLRAKYVVTCNHAKRVILTVWGVSVLCALPNTSLHGIDVLHKHTATPAGNVSVEIPDSVICTVVKPRWIYNLTIQVTTLLFFILPMLTLSILYMLIGLRLSSAVNPILYNLMSTRFREMFKEVMCQRPHHVAPRKHSLSVTRATLRSTLSDAPLSNGTAETWNVLKRMSLALAKAAIKRFRQLVTFFSSCNSKNYTLLFSLTK